MRTKISGEAIAMANRVRSRLAGLHTRTVVQTGINLPWQEFGSPYKGESDVVKDEGTVFVRESTLYDLYEQGVWDSQFGKVLLISKFEALALEQAGLAVRETRGGHHKSETFDTFMEEHGLA